MAWWMLIPAVISIADSVYKSQQQSNYGDTLSAWNGYNAAMKYSTALGNLAAEAELTQINAQLAKQQGEVQASAYVQSAVMNAGIIKATSVYNDDLLENELSLMWEGMDLDLRLLEQQRARERGTMLANQAASGTVMDDGSNFDAIVSQKTQEALDAFVIRHNADIQAKKIQNARAQNLWQGEMQLRKTMWDGQLGASIAMNNANAQAKSLLTTGALRLGSGLQSAFYQREADKYGLSMGKYEWDQTAQGTLTTGLFSAASQGVAAYYGSKVPDMDQPGGSLITQHRPVSNASFGTNPGL